ncbi:MAG: hypothetical protein ACI910_000771 [Oleispira sp.]|jgi:hypothetical protein
MKGIRLNTSIWLAAGLFFGVTMCSTNEKRFSKEAKNRDGV